MTTNGPIDRLAEALPWRWLMWGGLAGLLALPAVAMRFTDEVQWGPEDFLVMGIMFGTVGAGDLVQLSFIAEQHRRIIRNGCGDFNAFGSC